MDAMALVARYGRPDFLLQWHEIRIGQKLPTNCYPVRPRNIDLMLLLESTMLSYVIFMISWS
jgi:hypothetical protein